MLHLGVRLGIDLVDALNGAAPRKPQRPNFL